MLNCHLQTNFFQKHFSPHQTMSDFLDKIHQPTNKNREFLQNSSSSLNFSRTPLRPVALRNFHLNQKEETLATTMSLKKYFAPKEDLITRRISRHFLQISASQKTAICHGDHDQQYSVMIFAPCLITTLLYMKRAFDNFTVSFQSPTTPLLRQDNQQLSANKSQSGRPFNRFTSNQSSILFLILSHQQYEHLPCLQLSILYKFILFSGELLRLKSPKLFFPATEISVESSSLAPPYDIDLELYGICMVFYLWVAFLSNQAINLTQNRTPSPLQWYLGLQPCIFT